MSWAIKAIVGGVGVVGVAWGAYKLYNYMHPTNVPTPSGTPQVVVADPEDGLESGGNEASWRLSVARLAVEGTDVDTVRQAIEASTDLLGTVPPPPPPSAEDLRAPRQVPSLNNRESRYPRDTILGLLEDQLIEMFRENERRQAELQRFRDNRDSGRGDGSGSSMLNGQH